jgi:hypothetical protein
VHPGGAERLAEKDVSIGLEPDRRRRRQAQTANRRGEVLAAQVVGREEEVRPRVPGAFARPLSDRVQDRLGLRASSRFDELDRARELRVEVGGDGGSADVAEQGEAREQDDGADGSRSGDRVIG